MRWLWAAALLLMACSGGPPPPAIRLDGSPHVASDAGVITSADRHQVVVDGTRKYSVNPRLVVFTAGTLQLAPLASTYGRYALLGTRGSRVEWIEPLSVIASLPGGPPTVFYFGRLLRTDTTTATFSDGTVLGLAGGVRYAGTGAVRVEIDPATHKVRSISAS